MTDFDSGRRKILKAGGAALTIGLAGCIGPFQDTAGVPGTVDPDDTDHDMNGVADDDWLADVPNWDGTTEDLTGQDEVTVLNGDPHDEGQFIFEPPDIAVDPGTTVVWEWAGSDTHTVTHEVDDDEAPEFDSGNIDGDGETWEFTFEEEGVYDYYCVPHRTLEQKGRVTVGDPEEDPETQVAGWLADTPNWDGNIEDFTGEDDITIANGDPNDEGQFIYDPPAVTVDAGTTVIWEWAGSDTHTVTHEVDDDEEPEFDSGNIDGDGETWEFTFEEGGVYLYYCVPHRTLEQKGAVVVEE